MNNTSICTADWMTHFKIIAVSLIASLAVVVIGASARPVVPQAKSVGVRAPAIQAPANQAPAKVGPSMIAAAEQAAEIR
jgi:hypothetical protein